MIDFVHESLNSVSSWKIRLSAGLRGRTGGSEARGYGFVGFVNFDFRVIGYDLWSFGWFEVRGYDFWELVVFSLVREGEGVGRPIVVHWYLIGLGACGRSGLLGQGGAARIEGIKALWRSSCAKHVIMAVQRDSWEGPDVGPIVAGEQFLEISDYVRQLDTHGLILRGYLPKPGLMTYE